ncbi:hypothetical protein [Streptomyces sp. NPDC001781]
MRDFTRQPRVIEFKVDDDVFRCHPRLPAQVLIDFAVSADQMGDNPTGEQGITAMLGVLEVTLLPGDFKLFRERMSDPERAIELEQVSEIVPWIMESYGLRPTTPSDSSSDGPSVPGPGTSLTENTSAVASISANSPSIAS